MVGFCSLIGGKSMKGSILLFKIKGIRIEINFSWLFIFVLITYTLANNYFPVNYPAWTIAERWGSAVTITILFLFSILIHELAHSLVSVRLGIMVKRITLFIFGGIAEIEKEPDTPAKEIRIALAGPAASLILCILFLGLSIQLNYINTPQNIIIIFLYLSSVNFTLAVFNMVPAFPLDGGRVLRAIIWHIKKDIQKATKITTNIGHIFGYLLIFYGVINIFNGDFINGLWLILIGFFVNQSAQSSYQNMIADQLFSNTLVREFMTGTVVTVNEEISVTDLVEQFFLKYKFGVFPVSSSSKVTGIVSIRSVRDVPQSEWNTTQVKEILFPLEPDMLVSAEETVETAMKKIFGNHIGKVLVMENDALIGIVSRADILNYMMINEQLKS